MGLLLVDSVLVAETASSSFELSGQATTNGTLDTEITSLGVDNSQYLPGLKHDDDAALPRFSNVFQSHMVLQRDAPVKVWGFAADSSASEFVVTLCKQGVQSDCDSESILTRKVTPAHGTWSAIFPAQRGSTTPMLLIVGAQKLADIVFGDVLLFS